MDLDLYYVDCTEQVHQFLIWQVPRFGGPRPLRIGHLIRQDPLSDKWTPNMAGASIRRTKTTGPSGSGNTSPAGILQRRTPCSLHTVRDRRLIANWSLRKYVIANVFDRSLHTVRDRRLIGNWSLRKYVIANVFDRSLHTVRVISLPRPPLV